MSDVRCLVSSRTEFLRLRINSKKQGNRDFVLSKANFVEIHTDYGDKIICVQGTSRMGLIFTKRHNGVSVELSSIPINGERQEILISSELLDEILKESMAKSPKAPQIGLNNVDLSRPAAIFER